MFLRQFQYLIALEQEGHFGRAAEHCNVSQPSLSYAIRQLEEELDVPIILRRQRYQGLTLEGQKIIGWAKRLMADRKAMLEELAIMRKNLHGRIRIGAMPLSSPILPKVHQLFSNEYPAVGMDIQFIGPEQLQKDLKNFELDAGITYLDDDSLKRLHTLVLYEEHLSLMIPRQMLPAKKKTITWKETANLPLCLLSPFMRERQIINDAFHAIDCAPSPHLESNSIFQLAFHVMQGKLATIVPSDFTHANNAFPGTREIPITTPVISKKVGLVWEKLNPPLPMSQAFATILGAAAKKGAFRTITSNRQSIERQER